MRGSKITARPALTLVQGGLEAPVEWSWFCGHCAEPPPGVQAPAPVARVCAACGFGVLLEAPAEAVPTRRDAFMVIDSALLIQALSRRAESLLGVREDLAVNRPLADLLAPADAEARGTASLSSRITEALTNGAAPVHAFVRPHNTFGIRMRARIAACGPPRAALLVLEDDPGRDLRSVR